MKRKACLLRRKILWKFEWNTVPIFRSVIFLELGIQILVSFCFWCTLTRVMYNLLLSTIWRAKSIYGYREQWIEIPEYLLYHLLSFFPLNTNIPWLTHTDFKMNKNIHQTSLTNNLLLFDLKIKTGYMCDVLSNVK